MQTQQPQRSGEGRTEGFGRGRGGDRGARGRGGGRPGGPRGGRRGGDDLKDWRPTTKLGRLVKNGKVGSFEEIFRFCIPIKEPQIIDSLIEKKKATLKEEVLKVKPVQKQ